MANERGIAPKNMQGRSTASADDAVLQLMGTLDEEDEVVLSSVSGRLPGEASREELLSEAELADQPPYWATWGF
jgi:hypothetical protein